MLDPKNGRAPGDPACTYGFILSVPVGGSTFPVRALHFRKDSVGCLDHEWAFCGGLHEDLGG